MVSVGEHSSKMDLGTHCFGPPTMHCSDSDFCQPKHSFYALSNLMGISLRLLYTPGVNTPFFLMERCDGQSSAVSVHYCCGAAVVPLYTCYHGCPWVNTSPKAPQTIK